MKLPAETKSAAPSERNIHTGGGGRGAAAAQKNARVETKDLIICGNCGISAGDHDDSKGYAHVSAVAVQLINIKTGNHEMHCLCHAQFL